MNYIETSFPYKQTHMHACTHTPSALQIESAVPGFRFLIEYLYLTVLLPDLDAIIYEYIHLI